MIAIDTNLLVFAHRRAAPWHARAKQVLEELAARGAPWAIPWPCLHEFYGTVTRPGRLSAPSTERQAVDQIEAWLEAPELTLLADDLATWPLLRDLVTGARIVGAQVHDARIAALCIRHGVTELWTHDRDFLRFPQLRVRDPLVDIQPTGAREPRARHVTAPRPARAARPRRPGRAAARRRSR